MPMPLSTVSANSFRPRIFTSEFIRRFRSKILAQIHACVEMRDLFLVAVEHECRLLTGEKAGADHAFACLTPTRMIHVRVHVGVKSVLIRRHLVPKRLRLF